MNRVAERWLDRRTFGAEDLPGPTELAARKRALGMRVSVCLPALNEESTVGGIARTVSDYLVGGIGLVDELVVIDGGSTDRTAAAARAGGAVVLRAQDLLPEIPWVQGKGESLWRSLATLTGDVVVWLDADIRNFAPHFVTRLIAPLVLDESVSFVKGYYRRPLALGGELLPSGGGRVTELLARPLLNALFPELGGLLQPLAGEYAGRREVLERVPFFTGYSVEVGLLIDLLYEAGLDAIAQVDLEERVHRNRVLEELAPMAYAIGLTILRRAEEHGRLKALHDYAALPLMLPDATGRVFAREINEIERPPLADIVRAPGDRNEALAK